MEGLKKQKLAYRKEDLFISLESLQTLNLIKQNHISWSDLHLKLNHPNLNALQTYASKHNLKPIGNLNDLKDPSRSRLYPRKIT